MPSQLHEALLLLFRNRPQLAAEVLRDALGFPVPAYTEARIDSTDLTNMQPAEYRADLVVLLMDNVPVLGIVVEAQLARDESKRFSWPAYVASLRARIRCAVVLLVVCPEQRVAAWCSRAIHLGGGNHFTPLVLGPSSVPIVTDKDAAKADPELAVLSAMAHGASVDTEMALGIALAAMAASAGLDAERSILYFDLVVASLSEAARRSLQAMDPAKYEFQSDFAKHYIARGKAEGEVSKAAQIVIKLLRSRFGDLTRDQLGRIERATIDDLDRWSERVLSATSIDDALN